MSESSYVVDEWRTKIGTALAVLQEQMMHLRQDATFQLSGLHKDMDSLSVKLNDNLNERVSSLEYQMRTFQGLKSFMLRLVGGLLLVLLAAFFTNYIAMNNRTSVIEKQIEMLQQVKH